MAGSGGGSGGGIIGDKPINEWLAQYANLVAPFRVTKMTLLLAKYNQDNYSLSVAETQFLIRCLADVADELG